MATGKPAPTLDELVKGSYQTKASRVCWARDVDGLLRDYLEALRAEVVAGRVPVWARVVDTLRETFEVQLVYNTVKAHVMRTCGCPK